MTSTRDVPRKHCLARALLLALATGSGLTLGVTVGHAGTATSVSSRDELLAAAHADRDQHRYFDALEKTQTALTRNPDDNQAQGLQVLLLEDIGAADRALQLAQQMRPPPDEATMARLHADLVAHEIRWGDDNIRPQDLRQPRADALRALADLDAARARYGASQPDIDRRLRVDRLQALRNAQMYAQAVTDYENLLRDRAVVPAYALEPAADSLLAQRQPDRARPLYQQVLREMPQRDSDNVPIPGPHVGLMYAWSEAEHWQQASDEIDTLTNSEPIWLQPPGLKNPVPNPTRADVEATDAQLRTLFYLQAQGYRHLAAMLAYAPANPSLRREVGTAAIQRGWPRAGLRQIEIAQTLDPDDYSTRIELVEAHRALHDWSYIEPHLHELESVIPYEPRVQVLRREWNHDRGWQFDAEDVRGKGNAPDFGDHDNVFETSLASPLLDNRWRVYGVYRDDRAGLPEGHLIRRWAGGGVRYDYLGVNAYVQDLASLHGRDHDALEGGVDWALNDNWSLSGDYSTASVDTPLRARINGINARGGSLAVTWRQSELQSARLSAQHLDFNDGNRRDELDATWQHRLVTRPFGFLDGGLEASTSRNNLGTDAPYFNPARDRYLGVTAHYEGQLWRHYDSHLIQTVDLAAGPYWERGYGSGPSYTLRYGQQWTPKPGLAFSWGLSYHRQPYDGRSENRIALDLGLHWGSE